MSSCHDVKVSPPNSDVNEARTLKVKPKVKAKAKAKTCDEI